MQKNGICDFKALEIARKTADIPLLEDRNISGDHQIYNPTQFLPDIAKSGSPSQLSEFNESALIQKAASRNLSEKQVLKLRNKSHKTEKNAKNGLENLGRVIN